MSFTALAALALKVGPMAIRGISGLFGGSDTAEKVADIVEQADSMLMPKEQKETLIENELAQMPPEALVELKQLEVELEKEVTRRQEIAAQDRQADHHETQTTIREGDKSKNWIVAVTRPFMALISTCSACYYVISNPQPDLMVAGFLIGLGATYMGVRYKEKDKGIAS